ncbi:MAG: TonB-dependent receptor [Prolixibacteraceae bacterium]|nr:TonB-dependent receptor [Prolixibacteraceae bacterium]MBN2650120.1 TonB-dependent receptor [Prolixibacteraceae bacterium]
MRKIFVILLLCLTTTWVFSQNVTVSGYVMDKKTGERLLNANVYDANALKGTSANNYGFYSLSIPMGKAKIIASFIGYSPVQLELNITIDTTINFELEMQSGEIDEITIIGNAINKVEDTQMSMVDLSVQKIKKIPVILGEADVLKVIQLLPGVQSGTEGTSGIYVRGGGPDQNLFLLDGVPVYNASHLLGFFSVFNPEAIKSIQLYKGGFPAHFGGRLSSVVDINMKDGNMKEFKGEFSIGAISSKLMLEGPIIKDKTSFMVSARRTYLDIVSKPIFMYMNRQYPDEKVSAGAFFHDYNLKVNHIFNEKSRLYLSGYFGKDRGFGKMQYEYSYSNDGYELEDYEFEDEFGLEWGNIIGSARWNYLLSKRLFSNTTLTYSRYQFEIGAEYIEKNRTQKTKTEDAFKYYSGIEDITAKVDFDYFPNNNHAVKFGASYINHHFTPGATKIKFESVDIDDDVIDLDSIFGNSEIYAHEFSAYIEDDIEFTPRFKANAGLHLSYFMVDGKGYINPQPRLSLRLKATENWALKASYSRMVQHVHLLTTAGIGLPTDLWVPVTTKLAPPVSDQVAAGTAINFSKGVNFTVEGFYKSMRNLIEYKEGSSFMGSASNWEDKVEQGEGWAYGVEVMLEKTLGKTTGWIGYTWSKTERHFKSLNFDRDFPAKYDRRHDISIAFTHEFSERFDIGATWVYGTGNAVTLAVMEYPKATIPGSGSRSSWYNENLKDYGGRNNYRMPAYHRMDVGMNFHKQKKRGVRTWSISAYNAYNCQNPFMLMWRTDYNDTYNPETGRYTQYTKTKLNQLSLFPIIPSISYSFKF